LSAINNGRGKATVEILLKQAYVITSYMVGIMTFQTRSNPQRFYDGMFMRLVGVAVGIWNVASGTSLTSLFAGPSGATGIQVAP
jgi:hypothetical protein